MKIAYKHLLESIPSKPSIKNISEMLYQLGHEHEIYNDIFNLELTPNRGDCLSVNGLLRDLAVFYDVKLEKKIFMGDIKPLNIKLINNAPEACTNISFLKIDIEGDINAYKGELKNYFNDLDLKKNNFFTDISNYVSYETGQPTHCYDANKINGEICLELTDKEYKFETLTRKELFLKGSNLVFTQQENNVINLAGVMGGITTACSENTRSVIIECATFTPENIIGQSIKYDINSDAAYKFERGVDPLCHEKVLRRFLRIVEDHVKIKNIEIFSKNYKEYNSTEIPYNIDKVKKILGVSITNKEFETYLKKLSFSFKDKKIIPPSFRRDVVTLNDIAEEIARVIGYDNIQNQTCNIPSINSIEKDHKLLEQNIKNYLTEFGFFEVINNPFTSDESINCIKVDNPLDSNKNFLRTNLKKSLVDNLLYNERRQQDSIKLFEISNVYSFKDKILNKKVLGIICSGRVGKNYRDFSKKIDINYLNDILMNFFTKNSFNSELISRKNLDSKINNDIVYFEVEFEDIKVSEYSHARNSSKILSSDEFIKYKSISEFPSSYRDLSFSIQNSNNYKKLQNYILNYKNDLIKEIFIFDLYENKKNNEIKIGFRLIFQSKDSTITDMDVNNIINKIIDKALKIDGVAIPGLAK